MCSALSEYIISCASGHVERYRMVRHKFLNLTSRHFTRLVVQHNIGGSVTVGSAAAVTSLLLVTLADVFHVCKWWRPSYAELDGGKNHCDSRVAWDLKPELRPWASALMENDTHMRHRAPGLWLLNTHGQVSHLTVSSPEVNLRKK